MPDPEKKLKRIIRQMKKLQKSIAASGQPLSTHELDQLADLGRQYAEIVGKMVQKRAISDKKHQ